MPTSYLQLSKKEFKIMPDKANRPGNRLMDRPEYRLKQQPLTCSADISVFDAVLAMSEKNFGAIVVTDNLKKVIGVFTERDVMNKVVGKELNTRKTLVKDIMTPNPRVANETDDLIDWLRIMSNERFRRLPVVDVNGHIKAVFTQGDFVSYTWPDLVYQIKTLATATVSKNWALFLIIGGIALYSLAMLVLVKTLI
jgi:CBS domain-containing protein